MNISELYHNHYMPAIESRRRANTAAGYRSSFELHVLPRFGDIDIFDIEAEHVQEWVDNFELPGAAEKAFKCLRQLINWAIRRFKLRIWNPCSSVELPRKPKYKPEVLTPRRLKRLVRGFVGHKHEATLIVSAALGLRPGENYYLHWSDINWRTGLVPIRGTLQQVQGSLYEYAPKTAKSERDCWLPQWALDRLHTLWVEAGRPKGRIIGDATPSQVSQRIKAWIKKAKLPKISMKNLRHTYGTVAAYFGVPLPDLGGMMGHTDIGITYRYYYALTKATIKRAQRRIARGILGKTCADMYKGIELSQPLVVT